MSFKLSHQEQGEFERLANELTVCEDRVQSEFRGLLRVLADITDGVDAAIGRRNAVLEQCAKFAEQVRDRLADEFEDHGDRWKESDAGQDAQGLIDEWSIADSLEQMQEVQIVTPEIEGDFEAVRFGRLPQDAS